MYSSSLFFSDCALLGLDSVFGDVTAGGEEVAEEGQDFLDICSSGLGGGKEADFLETGDWGGDWIL